jgi:Zn-dependent protease
MTACTACNAEIADSSLSCPQCLRLTHATELEDLAKRARAAWRVGDFATERTLWAQSLALLPEDTVQHRTIQARLAELEQQTAAAAESRKGWAKATAGIGPAVALLLTKGKFLLLGLTKMGTLLTMLASLGVYWSLYGWAFGLGLVLSIYIHEMGHVVELRQYGIPASAPMFIPGLGAFIRMRGVRMPPVPNARIGLAGPLYGLGAAAAALAMYAITRKPIWSAVAHFGAVINLFNLIPVWQLDGSRGLHSLTRGQRLVVVAVASGLWMLTWNPMLFLIAAVAGYRLFTRDWQTEPDSEGLVRFALLLVLLTAVAVLAPVKNAV